MARVLISGWDYIAKRNIPKDSKHTLIWWYDLHRPRPQTVLKNLILGKASLKGLLQKKYHLIHTFNDISLERTPFLMTFSASNLIGWRPGIKDYSHWFFGKRLGGVLASDRCKKIIATSAYARSTLENDIQGWKYAPCVLDKTIVVHPSFYEIRKEPKTYKGDKLRLIFIGHDFGRKGGFVFLRVAKKMQSLRFPAEFHIVSELRYGERETEFKYKEHYAQDIDLLNLKNVVFHGRIDNKEVLRLLEQSHFQIMPSLHDVYGYSIVEGFTCGTPAITTNVMALPEIVKDNKNGYLLHLDLDQRSRMWADHPDITKKDQSDETYWQLLDRTFELLANGVVEKLVRFYERPNRQEHFMELSAGALTHVRGNNNPYEIRGIIDRLYSEAAGERI